VTFEGAVKVLNWLENDLVKVCVVDSRVLRKYSDNITLELLLSCLVWISALSLVKMSMMQLNRWKRLAHRNHVRPGPELTLVRAEFRYFKEKKRAPHPVSGKLATDFIR